MPFYFLSNKFKNICIWLPAHACVMGLCACVRSVSTATGSGLSSSVFDVSVKKNVCHDIQHG